MSTTKGCIHHPDSVLPEAGKYHFQEKKYRHRTLAILIKRNEHIFKEYKYMDNKELMLFS